MITTNKLKEIKSLLSIHYQKEGFNRVLNELRGFIQNLYNDSRRERTRELNKLAVARYKEKHNKKDNYNDHKPIHYNDLNTNNCHYNDLKTNYNDQDIHYNDHKTPSNMENIF